MARAYAISNRKEIAVWVFGIFFIGSVACTLVRHCILALSLLLEFHNISQLVRAPTNVELNNNFFVSDGERFFSRF